MAQSLVKSSDVTWCFNKQAGGLWLGALRYWDVCGWLISSFIYKCCLVEVLEATTIHNGSDALLL